MRMSLQGRVSGVRPPLQADQLQIPGLLEVVIHKMIRVKTPGLDKTVQKVLEVFTKKIRSKAMGRLVAQSIQRRTSRGSKPELGTW